MKELYTYDITGTITFPFSVSVLAHSEDDAIDKVEGAKWDLAYDQENATLTFDPVEDGTPYEPTCGQSPLDDPDRW